MSSQTILIVDDEPANLALMQTILADSYRLVFARNGAETLAAVTKHQPDLVLLDVGLPDINGYDLCRKIKQLDTAQGLQVIFVTSFADSAHEEAGFEAGGADYISKPVLPQIVRAGQRPPVHGARHRAGAKLPRCDFDARPGRSLQRHRYRRPHLAHGRLRPLAGPSLRLGCRALYPTGTGRPDARHRQNRHTPRHFAQTRSLGRAGVGHHENPSADRVGHLANECCTRFHAGRRSGLAPP